MLYEIKVKVSDYKNNIEYKDLYEQVKEYEEKLADLKSRNNLYITKGSIAEITLAEKMLSALQHRLYLKPLELGLLEWFRIHYEEVFDDFPDNTQVHIEYVLDKGKIEFKIYNLMNVGMRFDNGRSFLYAEYKQVTLFGSNKFDDIDIEVEIWCQR